MKCKHLDDVKEGYFTHCFKALRFAAILFFYALICIVHAFFPFLFQTYVSDKICTLNKYMQERLKK